MCESGGQYKYMLAKKKKILEKNKNENFLSIIN